MSPAAARLDVFSLSFYVHNIVDADGPLSLRWILRGLRELPAHRIGTWTMVVGLVSSVVVSAAAIRSGRMTTSSRSLILSAALHLLLFTSLLSVKTMGYMIALWPLGALILAWTGIAIWDAAPRAIRMALSLALALAMAEGAGQVAAARRAALSVSPYAFYTDQIARCIPPGSRVLGLQHYWLGLRQFEYRTWLLPLNLSRPGWYHESLTLEDALRRVNPSVVLLDTHMSRFFDENQDPARPYHRDTVAAARFLAERDARLACAVHDRSYGTMRVYHLQSAGAASGEGAPAIPAGRTSSLTTVFPGRNVVRSRRSAMGLLDVVDRRAFIASLGGTAAVAAMGHEERAEALEHYAEDRLNELVANSQGGAAQGGQNRPFPTVAELEAQVETRTTRRGLGNIFGNGRGNVRRLEKMPEKPTIHDFFRLRFQPANHVLQSATRALKTGMKEEVILACLLHDVALNLMHVDHGWWGAQMFEPYVPEKTSFAIRYHQTLRFFADEEAGYEYPDSYHRTFGIDYVPPPHIQAAYKMLRNHKWYMEPRLVTVNDLYSFDPKAIVSIDPFVDIIGRHFKQPKEGLGNDNSPVAHMWRTLSNPDAPL